MIGLRNLCTPALIYFVLSAFAIVLMAMQNINDTSVYCVGSYSCQGTNNMVLFAFKIIYVIFWTWLLNVLCQSGYETVSWVLVILPFVLMFIFVAMVFASHVPVNKYNPLF